MTKIEETEFIVDDRIETRTASNDGEHLKLRALDGPREGDVFFVPLQYSMFPMSLPEVVVNQVLELAEGDIIETELKENGYGMWTPTASSL